MPPFRIRPAEPIETDVILSSVSPSFQFGSRCWSVPSRRPYRRFLAWDCEVILNLVMTYIYSDLPPTDCCSNSLGDSYYRKKMIQISIATAPRNAKQLILQEIEPKLGDVYTPFPKFQTQTTMKRSLTLSINSTCIPFPFRSSIANFRPVRQRRRMLANDWVGGGRVPTNLLDTKFKIPGTRIRFGADFIGWGCVPVCRDSSSLVLGDVRICDPPDDANTRRQRGSASGRKIICYSGNAHQIDADSFALDPRFAGQTCYDLFLSRQHPRNSWKLMREHYEGGQTTNRPTLLADS